jgi:hypothetical protein
MSDTFDHEGDAWDSMEDYYNDGAGPREPRLDLVQQFKLEQQRQRKLLEQIKAEITIKI